MKSQKKRASTKSSIKKIVKTSKIAKLHTKLSLNLREGNTYIVVDILTEILSIDPKDLIASALQAIYYDMVSSHKDADELITDLLANQPDRWQPYYAQGMVEIMRGNVKSGKEKLNQAMKLATDGEGRAIPKSVMK